MMSQYRSAHALHEISKYSASYDKGLTNIHVQHRPPPSCGFTPRTPLIFQHSLFRLTLKLAFTVHSRNEEEKTTLNGRLVQRLIRREGGHQLLKGPFNCLDKQSMGTWTCQDKDKVSKVINDTNCKIRREIR
jgi:hypothetical protein